MAKREVIPFPDDFSAFSVAAVYTTLTPERLAWLLDQELASSFWRTAEPLEISTKKANSSHSCFRTESVPGQPDIWLIADCSKLLPAKHKPDFLLVAEGDFSNEKLQSWLQDMKSMTDITLAYLLEENVKIKLPWLIWLKEHGNTQNNQIETEQP